MALTSLLVMYAVSAAAAISDDNAVTFDLVEHSPPGTVLGTLSTRLLPILPADIAPNLLRFAFTTTSMTSQAARFFDLDPTTGRLTVTSSLDREQLCPASRDLACPLRLDIAVRPVQVFRVLKLTVRLLDINDNSPVFPGPRYRLNVTESTPVGTAFNLPAADDLDAGANGAVRYEFAAGSINTDDATTFRLVAGQAADGSPEVKLILDSPLDRETRTEYQLTVVARDAGSPSRSSSLLVGVSVLDVNDNSPRFVQQDYVIDVLENVAMETVVGRVQAEDGDAGENGRVTYSFARNTQVATHAKCAHFNVFWPT